MTPRLQLFEDKKKRVIELINKGVTSRVVIAERLGCSQEFVRKAIRKHKKEIEDEKAERVAYQSQ